MEITNARPVFKVPEDESITQSMWACLTRTCNFDCGYCYQGSHAAIPGGLQKFMKSEVMERALPWALRWTTRGLSVIWYGGEPLLMWPLIREQMPKWAAAFKEAGKTIRFSCTTNGSMLTREVREMFDEYRVGVLLSLDGPKRIHDQSRTFYDNDAATGKRRGTWDSIPLEEILAWRPCGPARDASESWKVIEVAWQLQPSVKVTPADLEEMISLGLTNLNFNLQWLEEWNGDQRIWLEEFMRAVGRRAIRGEIATNWKNKLDQALTVDKKMDQPCGTGLSMVGLSPEGWLYPSQEMVYTVTQPGRAPGTAEYYRLGDVMRAGTKEDPIINMEVLTRISKIRTEEMRPPAPFDCNNCIAKSASIGGCHCRYVGQDGIDPANRFDVAPGYCQSMISAVTGLVQAAAIERYIRPVHFMKGEAASPCGHKPPSNDRLQVQVPTRPIDLATILEEVQRVSKKLDTLDIVRIEAEGQ